MVPPFYLHVGNAGRGQRLDRFVLNALVRARAELAATRTCVQRWIASGCVKVDGDTARAGARLRGTESIAVQIPVPRPMALAPIAMDLQILYEDAHLLVINKPADLSVHPGAGPGAPTLVHGLLAHCRDLSGINGLLRPGIVHRLDKGTTGALVVAKNNAAHQKLAGQFAARTVHKVYLALAHVGALSPTLQSGHIDTPYGRHRSQRRRFSGRFVAAPGKRRAVTDWALLARGCDAALGPLGLVRCAPRTGRTHQLRVHLAELGCPIVGDAVYGGRAGRLRPQLPPGHALAQLGHQALHAWQLAFAHPATGLPMCFAAPLPSSWRQFAHTLLHGVAALAGDAPLELPCD